MASVKVSRTDGTLIGEGATVRGVAEKNGADLYGADLRGAGLRWADLCGADLYGANLRRADLYGADLRGADLRGANLCGADLYGANLRRADLYGADLRGADLRGANLCGADLRGALLPSPAMVLSADWGGCSDELTLQLMRYDASCHPDPEAFDVWAREGKPCPYFGCRVDRAAQFREKRELWKPGAPLQTYDLMADVLDEHCPGWRGEEE